MRARYFAAVSAAAAACLGGVAVAETPALAPGADEGAGASAAPDRLRTALARERTRHRAVTERLTRARRTIAALRRASARGVTAPTPQLRRIAACESGGDPEARSGHGTSPWGPGLYRGKYQFDARTWHGVGGRGDPAAAAEPEQDYRAWLLYERRGPAPWPVCGAGV